MLLRSKDHEFWISGKAKSNAVSLMLVIEGLVSEFLRRFPTTGAWSLGGYGILRFIRFVGRGFILLFSYYFLYSLGWGSLSEYFILFIDVHGGTRMPLAGGYVSLVVLIPMVVTMVDFREIPNSKD